MNTESEMWPLLTALPWVLFGAVCVVLFWMWGKEQ